MTDYFALYNLPHAFQIDESLLKQRYQQLQKLTHPDRFASASEQEKRLYMQKNAQVNDAYYVLKTPVKRGEHLLALRQFPLPDEQATMGDTEFLMQQMELREALDDADNQQQLEAFIKSVESLDEDLTQQIEQALSAQDHASNEAAASALTKLKFLNKLAAEADNKLQQVS